jgi:hypothetical protein
VSDRDENIGRMCEHNSVLLGPDPVFKGVRARVQNMQYGTEEWLMIPHVDDQTRRELFQIFFARWDLLVGVKLAQ